MSHCLVLLPSSVYMLTLFNQMRKLFILLLLLAGTTSVFAASTFQWSRLSHTRLNNFVRLTKLPVGQYLIGVYSTGNTIQEYTEEQPQVVTVTKEVIVTKEVPVEKIVEVEKQLPSGTIIISPEELATYKSQCFSYVVGWKDDCVLRFISSKWLR